MFEKVEIRKGFKEEEQGQRVCNRALCSLNLEGGSSRGWQGRAQDMEDTRPQAPCHPWQQRVRLKAAVTAKESPGRQEK